MFLVDTNVVSVSSPALTKRAAGVVDWMRENSLLLYMSVVTVAEITSGIANLRRRGALRKADALALWMDQVLTEYEERIIGLDVAAARVLGLMVDHARGCGLTAGFADIAIAATARAHGLTVLTRNVRHFRGVGVRFHDPFDSFPDIG